MLTLYRFDCIDDRREVDQVRSTPPPEARLRERCSGSAGLWPATGRRPARRRQERHPRAGHTPARGAAPGAMGSPGSARVPSACPCGGPVARLRARRPRSQGRPPSLTRRPCAAGPFQRRSEEVDGSVSGTGSWTSARHVLVTRYPLLPAERESDGASSIRGNPMNPGAPAPA